ncbi:hypothetical protein Tco_1573656 [Tanacetum coccineum]
MDQVQQSVAATSNDPKYGHIDIDEKQKDSLQNYADPVLLLSYIREKSETLAGYHVGVYSRNITEAVDEVVILAGLSVDIYLSVHADKLEVNRRVVSKNLEGTFGRENFRD